MKTYWIVITIAAAVSVFGANTALAGEGACGHSGRCTAAEADEGAAKAQSLCPVMGGQINKDLFVDHNGHRIYVCCEGCLARIKADPEKYVNKLKTEGTVLDRIEQEAKGQHSAPKTRDAQDKGRHSHGH